MLDRRGWAPGRGSVLELWRLRMLVEVAEHGSLSAAAESLAMTQPALSRAMSTLERQTGLQLLRRTSRGAKPTPAGRVLVDHAREMLARTHDVERNLRAVAGKRLRMGGFPSVNAALVADAIARFSAREPEVELILRSTSTLTYVSAVGTGDLDLALVTDLDVREGRPADEVELISLVEDPVLVALPDTHPCAADATVRLAALAHDAWIEGAHPDCLGDLEWLAAAFTPRIQHTCDDWYGKHRLVAAGVGVMLCPGLATETVGDGVVVRPLSPTPPPRRIYAVLPPARYRSPVVTAMVDALRDAADRRARAQSGSSA